MNSRWVLKFQRGKNSIRLLVLLTAFLLPGAVLVHALSQLPWHYSWVRTLELLGGAITDEYFVLMAVVVLLAGVFCNGSIDRIRASKTSVRSALIASAVAATMVLFSDRYGIYDYMLLPVFVWLLMVAIEQRDTRSIIMGAIATVVVITLVSYVFTIFKSQLFVVASPIDGQIIAVESVLSNEPLYSSIAKWAGNNTWAVSLADWGYYLFFHHMALTALFLFSLGDVAVQRQYVTALAFCYLIGGVSYFLVPAVGPVFYDPGAFSYLEQWAPFTVLIQDILRQATDAAAQGNLALIETFAFIACMPSLHMAHETIMLIFSLRSPIMFLFALSFWIMSALSVLVLGWHYVTDIFGGIALAVVVLVLMMYSDDFYCLKRA